MDYVEVKPKKVQKQNSFPIESSLRSATSSTPSRRGLQMARGEREGWEVPLHLLYHHHGLSHHHQHIIIINIRFHCTLFPWKSAGLPVLPVCLHPLPLSLEIPTIPLPKGTFLTSPLPLREWPRWWNLLKKSGRLYDNNFPGGAGQDLLGGFASWWREAGRCSRRQMGKGCCIFHHQRHFIFLIVVLFVVIVLLLLLFLFLPFLLLETNWKTIRAPLPPAPPPRRLSSPKTFHRIKSGWIVGLSRHWEWNPRCSPFPLPFKVWCQ